MSAIARQFSARGLEVYLAAQELIDKGEAVGIRRRAHLSLRRTGSLVKADHTAVGRWERGKKQMRSEAGLRYARFLVRLAERERDGAGEEAVA